MARDRLGHADEAVVAIVIERGQLVDRRRPGGFDRSPRTARARDLVAVRLVHTR
jgi:hypothetical protein